MTPPGTTHVMRLHDGQSGNHYELTLTALPDGRWQGLWVTCNTLGQQVPGHAQVGAGSATGVDAYTVFRKTARLIQDADDAVMSNDWDFREPLPDWLLE